jgi:hypothetical protein
MEEAKFGSTAGMVSLNGHYRGGGGCLLGALGLS